MKRIRALQPPAAKAGQIATLDRHPIVIRASRSRAILLLAACLGFLLLGATAIARGDEDVRAAALPAAAVFSLGIIVAGFQIARPATLTLYLDEVSVRTVFRAWRVRYDAVQSFFVYRQQTAGSSAGLAAEMVGFAWSDPPRSAWRGLSRFRASGLDGSFGAGWRLSAAALANLLNAARDQALKANGLAHQEHASLSACREEIPQ